jgi:hypothetical protein
LDIDGPQTPDRVQRDAGITEHEIVINTRVMNRPDWPGYRFGPRAITKGVAAICAIFRS